MADFEVKEIHGHREVEGRLEYLVEWTSEDFEGEWEFVELHKMRCAELLRNYDKKQELIKYWRNVLNSGSRSREKDLSLARKPFEFPKISDYLAQKPKGSDELPNINLRAKEMEKDKSKQQQVDHTPSKEVKLKSIYIKRMRRDVPHFLCEMSDNTYPWIEISMLENEKMLDQFYFIEAILEAERVREQVKGLADEGDEPKRKRAKISSLSSLSSSSSFGVKSPSGGEVTEISSDEDCETSEQSSSTGSLLCEICDKAFVNRNDWNDHIRNHKRYECFWCKKEYNGRSLPAHCRTKHKKRGLCGVCGGVAKSPAGCKNRCLALKGKLEEKKARND